jgi:iron complex outermembrane recepter protein
VIKQSWQRVSGIALSYSMAAAVAAGGVWGAPAVAQQAGAPSPDARAQSADGGGAPATPAGSGLGEIVVTAQRRNENLQKVPISITAVNADTLQKANVSDVSELNMLAPSLNFAEEGAWSEPHLRGIGTAASGPGVESAVAVYIDGVYQASMLGGAADFNSVKSVEVINGPQGTLFGRNATGGLIQIHTLDPSPDLNGAASVGYGNYNTVTSSAYINGGLAQNLSGNLAVDFSNQGTGYGHNLATGTDVDKTQKLFMRGKLLFEASDSAKFTLSGNYSHVDFAPAYAVVPGEEAIGGNGSATQPHDIDGLNDPWGHISQYGGALTSDFDLHPLHLQSITAYEVTDGHISFGGAQTPNPYTEVNINIHETHRQFSQEFQLASPSVGRLTWTLGLYYFHEVAKFDPVDLSSYLFDTDPSYPLYSIVQYGTVKTDSYAAYGQATFTITPTTHLTGGLRYTYEKRSLDYDNLNYDPDGNLLSELTTSGAKDFHAPTWRIALDHNFSPEILVYASYNRGYKSGGFNPSYVTTNADNSVSPVPFAPEKLDAYEIGVKTQTADHHFRFNVAGFLYNYTNIQVESFQTGVLNISNGAKARLYGADIDADAVLSKAFSLHAGASFLHTEFTSYPNADYTQPATGGGVDYSYFDATGRPLPFAPTFTATAAANYTIPSSVGDFKLNATYNYNNGWYAAADGRLRQPSYSLLNAQVAWVANGGKLEVDVWGKNLTNTSYAETEFSQFQADTILWAPPRTYGVTGKVKF